MKIGIAVLAIVMVLVFITALVIPRSNGNIGLSCLVIFIVLSWIMGFMLNKLKKENLDESIEKEEQEENQT